MNLLFFFPFFPHKVQQPVFFPSSVIPVPRTLCTASRFYACDLEAFRFPLYRRFDTIEAILISLDRPSMVITCCKRPIFFFFFFFKNRGSPFFLLFSSPVHFPDVSDYIFSFFLLTLSPPPFTFFFRPPIFSLSRRRLSFLPGMPVVTARFFFC